MFSKNPIWRYIVKSSNSDDITPSPSARSPLQTLPSRIHWSTLRQTRGACSIDSWAASAAVTSRAEVLRAVGSPTFADIGAAGDPQRRTTTRSRGDSALTLAGPHSAQDLGTEVSGPLGPVGAVNTRGMWHLFVYS